MPDQPTLQTQRLLLRPFTLADAPDVQRLAGDREIAATTLRIPHPYQGEMAEQWIASRQEEFERNHTVTFAITRRAEGQLLGAIGLSCDLHHSRAEMGYWIGKPYWNQGFCTEAAEAILHYGFQTLGLNRIHAHHFGNNPASGRILEKIGMKCEGRLRCHIQKWGEFHDSVAYGILRADYEEQHPNRAACSS